MGKWSAQIRRGIGKFRFNSVILLAAGSGTRLNPSTPKQYLELDGIPILVRSAQVFENCRDISEIVLVTRKEDVDSSRRMLDQYGITKLTRVVPGGETRQKSAKLGFDAVNPACDFVLLHDAARCLVTVEMMEAALETAYVSGAAACASRITDTIKRTNAADTIKETLDRENAWLVQTPQVFMADMYRAAAYLAEKEGVSATDDCALCERLGFSVKLVDCGKTNLKITVPEDLILAEAILKFRKTTSEEAAHENRTRI